MRSITLAVLAAFLTFSCLTTAQAQELTAKDIIQKASDKLNGISNKGLMKMTVVRPSWSREVSMKSWSIGDDYYMILITEPVKDKGQTFLKRQTDYWILDTGYWILDTGYWILDTGQG